VSFSLSDAIAAVEGRVGTATKGLVNWDTRTPFPLVRHSTMSPVAESATFPPETFAGAPKSWNHVLPPSFDIATCSPCDPSEVVPTRTILEGANPAKSRSAVVDHAGLVQATVGGEVRLLWTKPWMSPRAEIREAPVGGESTAWTDVSSIPSARDEIETL